MAEVGLPPLINPRLGVNQALVQGVYRNPISPDMQRRWLRSSMTWTDLRSNWRANKVIGAGNYGICGLWNYVGPDGDAPDHLVVKQMAKQDYQFQVESSLMERIMRDGGETGHIVKLYKAYHLSPGGGTSNVDPNPFNATTGAYEGALDVSRIYMEYCQGGDLHEAAARILRPVLRWSEEILWRIFHCLAKALLVLETGNEDPTAAPWPSSLAHFDIKPQNILIGERDRGRGEHQRFYPFKLCDFGLALPISSDVTMKLWIRQTESRGTVGFITPEQIYPNHPDRHIGSPTNIWNLGNLIHLLIRHQGLTDHGVQTAVLVPRFHNAPSIWQFRWEAFSTRTPTI